MSGTTCLRWARKAPSSPRTDASPPTSRPVEAEDATGAGDAFRAGFLIALLDGEPPERCAYFAREVAEMKLTRTGPIPDEIDRREIYTRLETVHTDKLPKSN